MKVMYQYPELCTSQGRNGPARSIGINAYLIRDSVAPEDDFVSLVPITSKGRNQNCYIDIPLSDFFKLVDMVKERLAKKEKNIQVEVE